MSGASIQSSQQRDSVTKIIKLSYLIESVQTSVVLVQTLGTVVSHTTFLPSSRANHIYYKHKPEHCCLYTGWEAVQAVARVGSPVRK